MRKIFFIISFSLMAFYNCANAQVALGMRGEAFNDIAYTEVTGNPYLINDWIAGSVILENNQKAAATLKFDIVANAVLYQGKNGEALELKNKFSSFTLNTTVTDVSNMSPLVFVNGYPATDKQTEGTFYQLIGDGKIRLLKYYKKTIDERPGTSYTSSTTKSFKLIHDYYVFKDNQLTEIQPNKKALTKLFDDHAAQLDAYLKTSNINFKNDTDLQKLFAWYNSLN